MLGENNTGAGNNLKDQLLVNCAMNSALGDLAFICAEPSTPTPVTCDATYPCPWGHTNDAPYENRDEAECGSVTGTFDCVFTVKRVMR